MDGDEHQLGVLSFLAGSRAAIVDRGSVNFGKTRILLGLCASHVQPAPPCRSLLRRRERNPPEVRPRTGEGSTTLKLQTRRPRRSARPARSGSQTREGRL
jgi:hypothetical protein